MGQLFAGRYELVDPLGEGGGGVVWRVWDHREHRYLAAKVLRQVDATNLLRFVREQSFRIDHAHVVTPLGWAGEDDQVLFTMPLVRGGTVATLIGDYGPLPPSWVATLLDQLLDALTTIHEHGLVHRDVKPANLLLDATGTGRPHLRLSDFGVAVHRDEPRLTRAQVVVGTPGYVAPEALAGAVDPLPTLDLYAAGRSALEMLVGAPSPAADDPRTALTDVAAPAALLSVVRSLLAADPHVRPGSADAARRPLAALRAAPLDDTIEVFDHVPPLPPGWGPAGPVTRDAPAAIPPGAPAKPAEAPETARRGHGRALVAASVLAIVVGVGMVIAALVLAVG